MIALIAILSPAKNMRPAPVRGLRCTEPMFRDKTDILLRHLRAYSPAQIESVMGVNPKIALSACISFQEFDWAGVGTPALTTYSGLAFAHIAPGDFTLEDIRFIAPRLRILSAFYGLLRPTDAIQPYRLEMGCRLPVEGGSLYGFWGDALYRALFATGDVVVNLASNEYSRAVTPYMTGGDRMVTCRFLTFRDGKYKTLATEAKMCRGAMVRYITKNRLTRPEDLRDFTYSGYRYVAGMGGETLYTFVRL